MDGVVLRRCNKNDKISKQKRLSLIFNATLPSAHFKDRMMGLPMPADLEFQRRMVLDLAVWQCILL